MLELDPKHLSDTNNPLDEWKYQPPPKPEKMGKKPRTLKEILHLGEKKTGKKLDTEKLVRGAKSITKDAITVGRGLGYRAAQTVVEIQTKGARRSESRVGKVVHPDIREERPINLGAPKTPTPQGLTDLAEVELDEAVKRRDEAREVAKLSGGVESDYTEANQLRARLNDDSQRARKAQEYVNNITRGSSAEDALTRNNNEDGEMNETIAAVLDNLIDAHKLTYNMVIKIGGQQIKVTPELVSEYEKFKNPGPGPGPIELVEN